MVHQLGVRPTWRWWRLGRSGDVEHQLAEGRCIPGPISSSLLTIHLPLSTHMPTRLDAGELQTLLILLKACDLDTSIHRIFSSAAPLLVRPVEMRTAR